jgi:integrase
MSIRAKRDASGKVTGYTADVTITDPVSRKKTRGKATYRTRDDARKGEREIEAAIRAGTWLRRGDKPPTAPPTLAEFRDAYKANYSRTVGALTLSHRMGNYDSRILPFFGTTRTVAELATEGEVLKFRDHLLEEGLERNTINAILGALGTVFAQAKSLGHITAKPPAGILSAKDWGRLRRESAPEIEVHSEEEFSELLQAADSPLSLCILLLAGDCGLRRGEILALDCERIRWGRWGHGGLNVSRQMLNGKGAPPKHGLVRDVPLSERAAEALKVLVGGRRTGPALLSHVGTRLYAELYYTVLKRAYALAGITYRNPHALRHTAISRLANTPGMALPWVQQIAGHRDIKTTMGYVHGATAHLGEAMAMAEARTRRVLEGVASGEGRTVSGSADFHSDLGDLRPGEGENESVSATSAATPGNTPESEFTLGRLSLPGNAQEYLARVPSAYLGEGALWVWGDRAMLEEMLKEEADR